MRDKQSAKEERKRDKESLARELSPYANRNLNTMELNYSGRSGSYAHPPALPFKGRTGY